LPAAIAIPAIVGAASAGASVVGAKMQSNAAKKAAQTQVTASNDALRRYEQINQPYLQAGQSSMNTLGRLMQPGLPYSPQQQQMDARGPMSSAGPMDQMRPPMMGGGPPGGKSPFASAMAPMGDMVKVQAPDGSVRDVPRQMAQTFLARGGKLVG
jgi:hypothetical protein